MDFADSFLAGKGGSDELEVQLIQVPHSWVSLPQTLVNALLAANVQLPVILRLVVPGAAASASSANASASQDAYVSWMGNISSSPDAIDVPSALAECMRLSEGQLVKVTVARPLPQASMVHMSAASREDFEVAEANANWLSYSVLEQAKVVRKGDVVPIWVRGQSVVKLVVHSTTPEAVVRLENESILSIGPYISPEDAATKTRIVTPQKRSEMGEGGATPSSGPTAAAADAGAAAAAPEDVAPQKAKLQGPFRLRVKEWPEDITLPVLQDGKKGASASCPRTLPTLGVFISPDLMEDSALAHGAAVSVQTKPARDASDFTIAVYAHPRVPAGHVMLARPLMAELALLPNSQVWLRQQYSYPASIARMTKATLSLLEAPELKAPQPAIADTETEADENLRHQLTAHKCEGILSVALAAPAGASNASALVTTGSGASSSDSDSAEVAQSVRRLLGRWLQAQIAFLNECAGPSATGAATVRCPHNMVVHLRTDDTGDLCHLLSLSAVPFQNTMYELGAADLDGSTRELAIEAAAPVPCPIANPLQMFAAWSRNIFWKAPPHARPLSRPTDFLPSGTSWLDRELRQVLSVAMPYLAIPSQTFWRDTNVPPPGGVLISGGRGSGKTALLERAGAWLAEHPSTMSHICRMDCRGMAGDKMKKIAQWFKHAMITALTHSPSVVLLDDVDSLMPSIPEHAPPQDQFAMEFVIEFIAEAIDWLHEKVAEYGAPVLLIATCADAAKLPKLLRRTGRLDHHVSVGAPNAQERCGMLAHMLRLRHISFQQAELEQLARRTEGFDASDLNVLLERAVHAVRWQRLVQRSSVQATISEEQWDQALAGFQPAASWEAGANTAADASVSGWSDVGGMSDVKDALFEAIELPLRFAKLVAKAPLRLRSGVLLYGPPGCGKTHAVRAAVAAAGVRFVGVKGPELLNKYIGASEEAVRSVFQRAQAAAPCVLFFDEFDSIAPQRGSGSDSTGVTERVVNQLLTEMDGAEKLEGVCVIAASNRPDLIDSALLRPGRLDRLLYCGFPTVEDRSAILKSLAGKVSLSDGIDCEDIARATDGFSGADLRAIISEAQLACVHRHLDALQASEAATGRVDKHAQHAMPTISHEDVAAAMASARPSLSAAERHSLEQKYGQFRKSREGNAPFSQDAENAQRAALDKMRKLSVALA